MTREKASCLNSGDHLHLFAWLCTLLFMCFWCAYMFHLYVYICLYCIAMIFNVLHDSFPSHPSCPAPIMDCATKGNGVQTLFEPQVTFLFLNVLTNFSFCVGSIVLLTMLQLTHEKQNRWTMGMTRRGGWQSTHIQPHKPLLVGWSVSVRYQQWGMGCWMTNRQQTGMTSTPNRQ